MLFLPYLMQRLNCCPKECLRTTPVDFKKPQGVDLLNVFASGKVLGEMQGRVQRILVNAGVPDDRAETSAEQMTKELGAAQNEKELDDAGKLWFERFASDGFTPKIDVNLMARNRWVADLIAPRLQAGTVLDHDSGDSYVARFIQEQRPDVRVHTCDSIDFRREVQGLPFEQYDYAKKNLPYEGGGFDQAIMATVLHHCDEPEKMFDEVTRTVKEGGWIFLFENTFKQGDFREQQLNLAFDWFFNAVLHRTELPCPFSHFCEQEWEYFLNTKRFRIREKLELGHAAAIPLPHVLYVAEKI